MTPEESEQIASLGAVFFQNMSSTVIFTMGLFGARWWRKILFNRLLTGVYILAFIIGMYIILRKEKKMAHKALIALILGGFVLVMLFTLAEIAANLFVVKFSLVVSLPGGLVAQEIAANSKLVVTGIVEDLCGNLIFLVADIAIGWRAWALWAENRLIKWTLLIILLADIGISIADAIADTEVVLSLNNNNTITLDGLSAALSLTVNIVATLLIAHQAWTHHQSTHAILHNEKTQVQAILLLMVESGAIYGGVQLSSIIIQVLDIHAAPASPIQNARYFLVVLYVYSAVLNPVALFILIQTGNTYEHTFHLEDVTSLEINSTPNVS
ncbi:hypothetical protein BT96DRAFT_1061480 [Gymnopus androsaceus JB14]|uniref:Uncharacterized protein n=1 Tax=Gymnopus androsaceus JB14 TaxID=1447944 RepID=A0A6A4I9F0_9AGAR|nr:hypothetical protein BT96DRAFT_1061480 [Gymnopus androsaceus JB14]